MLECDPQPCEDLSTAFFPVALRPVFMASPADAEFYQCLDRHRAVVDVEREYAFALVTEGYELITNQMAYELSGDIVNRVFQFTALDDLECFNITMPKSRSFCHIDLIDGTAGFLPWKGDKWTAFLRITNSYNRTRRLRYQLGFCRWICRNGMIFGAKSIEFSNSHTRQFRERTHGFADTIGDIKSIEEELKGQLHQLRELSVSKTRMRSIFCRAFDIRVDGSIELGSRRAEQLARMRRQVDSLTSKYFGEFGYNCYAALNVLTEYASSPVGVISPEGSMDSLQRRTADWMREVLKDSAAPGFSWDGYLNNFRDIASRFSAMR